jgi:hypothetical protein
MPPNKDQAVVADAAPAVILSLNDFCARLSETVKATELIGGFAYSERVAGRLRDTAEAFKQRYDEFINKPV